MTRFLSDSKLVRFVTSFVAVCVLSLLAGWVLFDDPPTRHLAGAIGAGLVVGVISLGLPNKQRSP